MVNTSYMVINYNYMVTNLHQHQLHGQHQLQAWHGQLTSSWLLLPESECAWCVGFRGPPKPAAKEKEREREKEKEAAKSESSHELAPQARAERAKW